jgi:hypothetical protein
MLFLPESIYESRRLLMLDRGRGKAPPEQTWLRMLDLDPADYVSLLKLGRLRREADDLAGSEAYYWRAIHANPWDWSAYLELARLLSAKPKQAALAEGLSELAIRKLLLDGESLKKMKPEPIPTGAEDAGEFDAVSKAGQFELVADGFRRRRHLESEAVTARLRPYRLLHQLQEASGPEPQLVDEVVREGKSILPLLVGVLRGWAQDFLPKDGESSVVNTLALLGEIGEAAAIPHLLEFVVRDPETLSGAAEWALDRIIALDPERAAEVLGEIASSLDAQERTVVADKALRFPKLDAAAGLFERLSENLDRIPNSDCDPLFPVLCSAIVVARGRAGIELARAVLRRNAGRLPRKTRTQCEQAIEALGGVPVVPRPAPKPSQWTVYDICAGRATWEDGESEEQAEEEFHSPEPVQRKPTPGRNDPCWCGSGKKYKKCHLDADQQPVREAPAMGGAPAGREAPALPRELDGLRQRLGDFLAETVPPRDRDRAIEEFLDGAEPGEDLALALVDWVIHDWVSPKLGRTVLQEYLRRHGARLVPRERELIESWSRSFVGLYEVREVKAGTGIEVKNLISDEVFFVHDVSLSKQVVRWDGLLARVVEGERGQEVTGLGVVVPRRQIEPMREWMEQDRRRTGMPWPEYLKHHLPRIRRQPARLGAEWVESLHLCNRDGDEILFSKALYRVLDRAALIAALRSCPDLGDDLDDGTNFTWLKDDPGPEGRTVLGSFRIEGRELAFECNSKQRHKRGMKLLAGLAGSALRHLRDEFTTQKEMKRRTLEKPRAAESKSEEIPLEVRRQLLTEYMERHFATWPDTPIPALDGKTARQAVKTAAGRSKVSALLRDFENGEEHKRLAGEPYYDIARLRAELGLEP